MSHDVEVLIVSYASAEVLERCLASVNRHAPGASVAVREHSSDAVAVAAVQRIVADFPGSARLELDPTNPGFGAGCNALAANSSARWLVMLNPDAELVSWPWAGTHPPAGTIVGPRIDGRGKPGAHYGPSFTIADEIARSWFRRPGPVPQGAGFVSGAAMLVDAASFAAVGGFDTSYFLFYEDIDFCLRANRLGVPTIVDQRWRVHHTGGHSTGRRFGQAIAWSYESASRFHAAQGSPLAGYRAYVVTDSITRAAVHAARGRFDVARSYLRLARRAAADVVRSRRPLSSAPDR